MRELLSALLVVFATACTASDTASATGRPDVCETLFDFSDAADRAAWRAENDTVMGGNSDGRVEETDMSLVFAGDLVTRDGGFVQMSARVPNGALASMTSLRIVGHAEGRPWRARVTTNERVARSAIRGRGDESDASISRSGPDLDGPRVSFSAVIEALPTARAELLPEGKPYAGTASFSNPEPSVRGRPVPNAAWEPSTAYSLGLILADGRDAPFRLEVERIEACQSADDVGR